VYSKEFHKKNRQTLKNLNYEINYLNENTRKIFISSNIFMDNIKLPKWTYGK